MATWGHISSPRLGNFGVFLLRKSRRTDTAVTATVRDAAAEGQRCGWNFVLQPGCIQGTPRLLVHPPLARHSALGPPQGGFVQHTKKQTVGRVSKGTPLRPTGIDPASLLLKGAS